MYLNAIQTSAPHYTRYLAAAVITNTAERRRYMLQDLARVIKQEQSKYEDALTQFVTSLLIDFDFEGAGAKIDACKALISQDYFLKPIQDTFERSARLFIFETYCRIHQAVSVEYEYLAGH